MSARATSASILPSLRTSFAWSANTRSLREWEMDATRRELPAPTVVVTFGSSFVAKPKRGQG